MFGINFKTPAVVFDLLFGNRQRNGGGASPEGSRAQPAPRAFSKILFKSYHRIVLKSPLLKSRFLVLSAFLCIPPSPAAEEPDYADPGNWVLNPADQPPGTAFDVFYLYPTLVVSREKPLMDCSDPKTRGKTRAFTEAQTSIFSGVARIYAPFVRQQEFLRCMESLGKENPDPSGMEPGISDAVRAFRHYLQYYNRGRPYILFGHSQGALELFLLLKRCPEISPRNGFVAAYLPGIPVSKREIRDLENRGIRPGRSASDTGVLLFWNTQSREAGRNPFRKPGSLVVNPLSWTDSGTPAPKELNSESFFYDWKKQGPPSTIVRKRHFTGAAADPANGVLTVELPPRSEFDSFGKFTPGVFHLYDVWLFAGNLRANALERVGAYKASH